MPDGSFRDALEGVEPFSVRGRITIVPGTPLTRFVLRGGGAAVSAASGAIGFMLPDAINRAATDGARAAFRLGPDEWLLLAPDVEAAAFRSAIADATTEPHSLVEVTNRNTAIMISGGAVEDVLNAHNPLDLSIEAFPVGMATRTLLAKAEVVLWRKDALTFHIECWRSFAPYVFGQLIEAAREYRKG